MNKEILHQTAAKLAISDSKQFCVFFWKKKLIC